MPIKTRFLRAGFTALRPLEAKAELDVRELKPKYEDRLALFGNIDMRQLTDSRETIEEEIRTKVSLAKQGVDISTIQIALFHITSLLKTTSLWLRCLRNMERMIEPGTGSPLKLEAEKPVGYLLRSYTYCCLI